MLSQTLRYSFLVLLFGCAHSHRGGGEIHELLEDLMEQQGKAITQVEDLGEQATLSERDYQTIAETAVKLSRTATTLRDRVAPNFSGNFAGYADELLAATKAMEAAALSKSAEPTKAALKRVGDACASCHTEYD